MSFDVQDTTALITGANRGIGQAIAEAFIGHGAAKVYAAVRDLDSAAPLVDAYGKKIVPIHVDLTKPDTIVAAARTANDVELVVNNAGVLGLASPLDEQAIDTLRFENEVNVYGLIHVAQAFAPVLEANGGGAFVQLNSVASLKCFANTATYCASKASAYAITQALRDVLADQGTTVVSVHPGPIATDMAVEAGMIDMAEPPEVVAEAIITALKNGEFHVFPDAFARQVGAAYRSFADEIIGAVSMAQ